MRYLLCLLMISGCGSVDAMALDDGAAGVDGSAMAGAAGGSGSGGSAGTGGSPVGSGGSANVGSAGTGGSPLLLALGAACTEDTECGSGTCDMRRGPTGSWTPSYTCCTGNRDTCNTCVNGQLTPKPDGSKCGVTTCDQADTTTALIPVCQAGACTGTKRFSCTSCDRDARCGSKLADDDKVCGTGNFQTTVCTPN